MDYLLDERPIHQVPFPHALKCSECGRLHRFGVLFFVPRFQIPVLICLPCVRWFGWGGRHREVTRFLTTPVK